MTPERLAIIKESLDRRQTDLTVVMENIITGSGLLFISHANPKVEGIA
jgi:hypothetical protein